MKYIFSQWALFLFLLPLFACTGRKDEPPVIPPVTAPLSREYIGYGVITSSFTHISADPAENSASLGYLRRGALVRILRRQTIRTANNFISWVLIEGDWQENFVSGWLKEETMNIFENESQAKTASESF